MRFSSFLAESHGADCPSKKLWNRKTGGELRSEWWNRSTTWIMQRMCLISCWFPGHTQAAVWWSKQMITSNYKNKAQKGVAGVSTRLMVVFVQCSNSLTAGETTAILWDQQGKKTAHCSSVCLTVCVSHWLSDCVCDEAANTLWSAAGFQSRSLKCLQSTVCVTAV